MTRAFKIKITGIIMAVVTYIAATLLLVSVDVYRGDDTTGIEHGDIIFSNRLAPKQNLIQRGDLVTFVFDDGSGERLMVRRIVGFPGEKVGVDGDGVWINDVKCTEDYVTGYLDDGFMVQIPEGQALAVCDYRSNEDYPAEIVSASNIVGTVFYSFRVPEAIKQLDLWEKLYS